MNEIVTISKQVIGFLVIRVEDKKTMSIHQTFNDALKFCNENNLKVDNLK